MDFDNQQIAADNTRQYHQARNRSNLLAQQLISNLIADINEPSAPSTVLYPIPKNPSHEILKYRNAISNLFKSWIKGAATVVEGIDQINKDIAILQNGRDVIKTKIYSKEEMLLKVSDQNRELYDYLESLEEKAITRNIMWVRPPNIRAAPSNVYQMKYMHNRGERSYRNISPDRRRSHNNVRDGFEDNVRPRSHSTPRNRDTNMRSREGSPVSRGKYMMSSGDATDDEGTDEAQSFYSNPSNRMIRPSPISKDYRDKGIFRDERREIIDREILSIQKSSSSKPSHHLHQKENSSRNTNATNQHEKTNDKVNMVVEKTVVRKRVAPPPPSRLHIQRDQAARKIQSLGRGYIARSYIQRCNEAATKIQKVGRGHITRSLIRQQLYELNGREDVAENNYYYDDNNYDNNKYYMNGEYEEQGNDNYYRDTYELVSPDSDDDNNNNNNQHSVHSNKSNKPVITSTDFDDFVKQYNLDQNIELWQSHTQTFKPQFLTSSNKIFSYADDNNSVMSDGKTTVSNKSNSTKISKSIPPLDSSNNYANDDSSSVVTGAEEKKYLALRQSLMKDKWCWLTLKR
jgi:hypothetical protein